MLPRPPHPALPISLRASLCAGVALVLGCAVGPDYLAPEVSPPDAWHQAIVPGLADGEFSLETWWTHLDDPVLDGLIERARNGSLGVRDALARIDEARARRGIAIGEFFPGVDVGVDYQRSKLSKEVVGPSLDSPSSSYSGGLGASWEVDLFGRIRRSAEAADAELEASVEDYRDVLVLLFAEVATSYVDVRSLQARIRFAEDNLVIQRESLEVVQVRNRVGLVGDLDLRQAELNLARTASFIPGLRSRLVAALNRIAVLVGEYPPAIRTELQDSSPVPVPGDDLLVGLPADVLRQRPDVRSAERQLAAQTARIGVATADLYPRLALLGQISLDSTTAAAWFTGGAHSWGIGPQLRWNVFDGGRIRSNIQAQEALADQALSFYEQTLLLAVEEVENALTDFAEERNRYAELERSSEAAGKSVALVKILYRTGLVDFLNVSESERSLFEEQDQLAASQGRVATNWIGIYRALGGGWQP